MTKSLESTTRNAKVREAQKKMKSVLKSLRKKTRLQSKILANKNVRIFPKSTCRRIIVSAIKERFGDRFSKKVFIKGDSVNAITSVVVNNVMNDLAKCRDFCLQSGKTTLTDTNWKFVVDGVVRPRKLGFAALVA